MSSITPDQIVNLASDTETRPTVGMRQTMMNALVGDEQKGTDPTVNVLLERVADLLGKEAALFLPTGTLCNQVAIRTHTRPGDVVITDHMAHVIRAEAGGAAINSGIQFEPIVTEQGVFYQDQLYTALDRIEMMPYPYRPRPSLVVIEQTHNFGGGTVWPSDLFIHVTVSAKTRGLSVHIDGARLMNAVIATGSPAAEMVQFADSVWIDFTKGLGAPFGAVLAGSRAFIQEARRYKHTFGAAMRQAGIMAAGCIYALDHHVERLAEDHANARLLADALNQLDQLTVITPQPQSNIVFFDVTRSDNIKRTAFLEQLKMRGVIMSAVGRGIRAVTHLDTPRASVEYAIQVIHETLRATAAV